MKEFFKKLNWFYIASAVLYFALGLVCVIIPNKLTSAIPYVIGALLLINGTIKLIGYFFNKKSISVASYNLTEGILDIILAIVIFLNAGVSLVVIAVLIGVWALISGIMNINFAINKATNKQDWILDFVFAVVQIIIGIVLFFNFKGGITVSIIIAGIYLMFLAISMIITKVLLKKEFNNIKQKVERAMSPTKIILTEKETKNNDTLSLSIEKNEVDKNSEENLKQDDKPKTSSKSSLANTKNNKNNANKTTQIKTAKTKSTSKKPTTNSTSKNKKSD